MKSIHNFIKESIEPCRIGSFYVVENISEGNIGDFKGGKYLLNVDVWMKEGGTIPHFHVSDNNKNIDACIMINEARYFSHGYHSGKLNTKQRKALNDFLSSKNEINVVNYDLLKFTWNRNNSNVQVDLKIEQPDYRFISDYK